MRLLGVAALTAVLLTACGPGSTPALPTEAPGTTAGAFGLPASAVAPGRIVFGHVVLGPEPNFWTGAVVSAEDPVAYGSSLGFIAQLTDAVGTTPGPGGQPNLDMYLTNLTQPGPGNLAESRNNIGMLGFSLPGPLDTLVVQQEPATYLTNRLNKGQGATFRLDLCRLGTQGSTVLATGTYTVAP